MTTSAPQPFVHRSSLVSATAQVWNQPPASATRAANLTISGRWPATTWYSGMGVLTGHLSNPPGPVSDVLSLFRLIHEEPKRKGNS
jgi:hypothetical protein